MKKLFMLATMMLMVMTSIFAQDNVTKVTFTGEQQNKAYQKLDSVLVTNLTQNWSEVVYYPDTLILLSNVGITDYESRDGQVHLYQNIPNPFHGVTNFNLSLGNKEKVDMVIYDISGRKVAEYHNTLPSGEHQFRAAMDIPQTYLLSAVTKSGTTSIKMINLSNTGEKANIELISSLPLANDYVKKESVHGFKVGDEMQYVAYATQNDGVKDVTVKKAQTESETITFVFPNEDTTRVVTVTTGNADNIGATTATLSGTYVVRNAEVKETGFEYKKSSDEKFEKFLGTGLTSPFSATLKALEAGTEYTYKAYVKTAEDAVYYGEEKTFTTTTVTETVVITDEATDISKRSATLHGSYALGSDQLMVVGFELKADGKEYDAIYSTSKLTSPFEYACTEKLEPGTKYICRAFATTLTGKQLYGNEVSFTTVEASPELPVVKTLNAETEAYNKTKAKLSGELVSDGYCTMKEVGFYFSTTPSPLKEGIKYPVSGFDKKFQYETEMLAPATTYYYIAYATNEQGTAYGDMMEFTTRNANKVPNINITKIEPFATSAKVSCDVNIRTVAPQVNEEILEKGVCASEKENPTTDDLKVVADNTRIAPFVTSIPGLKQNTTYYVRGFITTFAGTIYSNQEKVTTITMTKPEVKTVSVDKIGNSNATVSSQLISTGGSENVILGVRIFNKELNFDSTYTFSGTLAADNTFATKVSRLKKLTKYSAQAYAKNDAGEAFGQTIDFTTAENFACGDMMEDVEGNVYNTVKIGSFCWMSDNLRTKHYADGRELGSWIFGNITERFCTEIKNENLPGGSNVYYPWATAADNAKGNTDPDKHIQGICPDGWHLPSYKEFSNMINAVDNDVTISLDEWSKRDGCGLAGSSINSNNMLAVKLGAKEGLWKNYAAYGAGLTGNYDAATLEDTPGFVKDKDINAPWNESGFNGWPCGYINKNGSGDPINHWMMNGEAIYQTNYSTSGFVGTYSFKFGYNNTGASIYSWTDMEGCSGYSVRCVQDTVKYIPPVVDSCSMHVLMDNEWGGKISVTISVDGKEDTTLVLNPENPAFEQTFYGQSFTITLVDLVDGNSFSEQSHLLLEFDEFFFDSPEHLEELTGNVVTISYNCGDKQVTIKKE